MSPDMSREAMELDVGYRFSDGTTILDSLIRLHLIIWVLKGGKCLRLWSQQELRFRDANPLVFKMEEGTKSHGMCVPSRGWQKLAPRSWERQKQRFSFGPSGKNCTLILVQLKLVADL